MRWKRLLTWLLVLLVILAIGAGWLYMRLSRVPAAYAPARLTQAQRDEAAGLFINDVTSFDNKAQERQGFDWILTAEQVNAYLASMDEIAAILEGRRNASASRVLAEARLAGPAVVLDDGLITFMIRQTEHNKVLAADVRPEMTDAGELRLRLVRMRVGVAPLPESIVEALRDELKLGLAAALHRAANGEGPGAAIRGVRAEHVRELLAVLVAAIDEEPVAPEFISPISRTRVRVESLRVDDGQLRLRIRPVDGR